GGVGAARRRRRRARPHGRRARPRHPLRPGHAHRRGRAVLRGARHGCATAVDPIAVYRRALTRLAASETEAVTFRGRPAYRFALPMQRLPDAARVAQVVTVDAHTLLPERIEWRVHRPGRRPHAAA